MTQPTSNLERFSNPSWHQATPNFLKSLIQTGLKDLLLLILFCSLAEAGIRTSYFFFRGQDHRYLGAPGGEIKPVAFPSAPTTTHVLFDACSDRNITFTVNDLGVRGEPWQLQRTPGTIRIAVVGGSSTYGASNPDNATWPALLQQQLKDRSETTVEVLNAGLPGDGIADFHQFYLHKVERFEPDWVLYYEGWNDTNLPTGSQVDRDIRWLHQHTRLSSVASWLYRYSWLYTLLLEKSLFTKTSLQDAVVPNFDHFRVELESFVQTVRSSGARPVFVLQALEPDTQGLLRGFRQELQEIRLEERTALESLVTRWLQKGQLGTHDPMTRLRIYQTQILLKAMQKMGTDLNIAIIDPRESFKDPLGKGPLFCDVVHLTDQGSFILAKSVAEELTGLMKRR